MGRPNQCNSCCAGIAEDCNETLMSDCKNVICVVFSDHNHRGLNALGGRDDMADKIQDYLDAYPERLLFVLDFTNTVKTIYYAGGFLSSNKCHSLREEYDRVGGAPVTKRFLDREIGDDAARQAIADSNDPWGQIKTIVTHFGGDVQDCFDNADQVALYFDDKGSLPYEQVTKTVEKLRADADTDGKSLRTNGWFRLGYQYTSAGTCPEPDGTDFESCFGGPYTNNDKAGDYLCPFVIKCCCGPTENFGGFGGLPILIDGISPLIEKCTWLTIVDDPDSWLYPIRKTCGGENYDQPGGILDRIFNLVKFCEVSKARHSLRSGVPTVLTYEDYCDDGNTQSGDPPRYDPDLDPPEDSTCHCCEESLQDTITGGLFSPISEDNRLQEHVYRVSALNPCGDYIKNAKVKITLQRANGVTGTPTFSDYLVLDTVTTDWPDNPPEYVNYFFKPGSYYNGDGCHPWVDPFCDYFTEVKTGTCIRKTYTREFRLRFTALDDEDNPITGGDSESFTRSFQLIQFRCEEDPPNDGSDWVGYGMDESSPASMQASIIIPVAADTDDGLDVSLRSYDITDSNAHRFPKLVTNCGDPDEVMLEKSDTRLALDDTGTILAFGNAKFWDYIEPRVGHINPATRDTVAMQGSVEIHQKAGNSWVRRSVIKNPLLTGKNPSRGGGDDEIVDQSGNEYFGTSIAISPDGKYLVVGCPRKTFEYEENPATGFIQPRFGVVFVYDITNLSNPILIDQINNLKSKRLIEGISGPLASEKTGATWGGAVDICENGISVAIGDWYFTEFFRDTGGVYLGATSLEECGRVAVYDFNNPTFGPGIGPPNEDDGKFGNYRLRDTSDHEGVIIGRSYQHLGTDVKLTYQGISVAIGIPDASFQRLTPCEPNNNFTGFSAGGSRVFSWAPENENMWIEVESRCTWQLATFQRKNDFWPFDWWWENSEQGGYCVEYGVGGRSARNVTDIIQEASANQAEKVAMYPNGLFLVNNAPVWHHNQLDRTGPWMGLVDFRFYDVDSLEYTPYIGYENEAEVGAKIRRQIDDAGWPNDGSAGDYRDFITNASFGHAISVNRPVSASFGPPGVGYVFAASTQNWQSLFGKQRNTRNQDRLGCVFCWDWTGSIWTARKDLVVPFSTSSDLLFSSKFGNNIALNGAGNICAVWDSLAKTERRPQLNGPDKLVQNNASAGSTTISVWEYK